MLIFVGHIAFNIALIGLVITLSFFLWIKKQVEFGKVVQIISSCLVGISFLMLLCSTYYNLKYWETAHWSPDFCLYQGMGEMNGFNHMGMMQSMQPGGMMNRMPGTPGNKCGMMHKMDGMMPSGEAESQKNNQ